MTCPEWLTFGACASNIWQMTRHGRLYPGTAPNIEGPTVNSEKSEMTSPADLAQLFSPDGAVPDSPFL